MKLEDKVAQIKEKISKVLIVQVAGERDVRFLKWTNKKCMACF